MPQRPNIAFADVSTADAGTLVVFAADQVALGDKAAALNGAHDEIVTKAAAAEAFKGKRFATMRLAMPRGLSVDHLLVVGLGKLEDMKQADWSRLGGAIAGALPAGKNGKVTILAERPDGVLGPHQLAELALGLTLRTYSFNKYKTKKDDPEPEPREVVIAASDPDGAARRWEALAGVADGVMVARDLTNEPANVLGPVEFADRAAKLSELGVDVTVLEPAELERLDMRALLGVAQGSERPARVVVMRWNGAASDGAPVALVGKGVVFDTGGISIKPAGGMEDMKGDMGGAAAVVGTMHALASRKAKVNALGIIGLVENMPDGKAQRPGDVVVSKSGQTIEIINTDAEGRLVLADLLTHVIDEYAPRVVIDLATLTGAIIVALGHHHAGMYTEDDTVAAQLSDAGSATGDLVWRMPLGKDYDSLIDSKIADVKNTGGRSAGSITAAQFLKRFAKDALWVHLDVAGVAMAAPQNEVSRTFGSGFGVRLLDRYIERYCEDGAELIPTAPEA